MGVVYARKEFEKRDLLLATIEMFVSFNAGPAGTGINYATYESLVQSLANANELRKLRKEVSGSVSYIKESSSSFEDYW